MIIINVNKTTAKVGIELPSFKLSSPNIDITKYTIPYTRNTNVYSIVPILQIHLNLLMVLFDNDRRK